MRCKQTMGFRRSVAREEVVPGGAPRAPNPDRPQASLYKNISSKFKRKPQKCRMACGSAEFGTGAFSQLGVLCRQ
jgi:hypothetical protein